MKILQISRRFLPSTGGIENVIYGLSKALEQRGYSSKILTLHSSINPEELVDNQSCIHGLTVYRLPYIGSIRYPITPGILSFVPSYDILHIHAIDFFIDFLSLTRSIHRKPIVVNTHGGIFHTKQLLPLKQLYFKTFTRLSLGRVDAVVCVSQHDYDLFRPIVSKDKLHIISNGVNVEPFLAVKKQITPGMLLGIGRVVENKRIEKLINLLPALEKEFPNVHLVWIGNDPHNRIPQLLAQAQQLGVGKRVHFTGQVSDTKIQDLLSQAHLFVSAASYEAFGLSTIEAMSSATVPVVTPVGIHPEVVKEGQTGFICNFEDKQAVDSFRYALSLAPNEISQIGQNAKEAAIQFSWSKVVDSYLEIYQSVLAANKTVYSLN